MEFGGVDLGGGRTGAEHAKDAEKKVPSMVGLLLNSGTVSTCVGEFSERQVPAMTVASVGLPPLQDPFGSVGFADVVLAARRVGDEVDACTSDSATRQSAYR